MRRILLVEDEPEILKAVSNFLEKKSFGVSTASDAEKALNIIDSGDKVDLAVLDIKMPGMNGIECLKKMRKKRPGLAAVFFTGTIGVQKYAKELNSLGYDPGEVLQKPVDLNKLVEQVRKRLGRTGEEKQEAGL